MQKLYILGKKVLYLLKLDLIPLVLHNIVMIFHLSLDCQKSCSEWLRSDYLQRQGMCFRTEKRLCNNTILQVVNKEEYRELSIGIFYTYNSKGFNCQNGFVRFESKQCCFETILLMFV